MTLVPALARLLQNFFRRHLIASRNLSPNTVYAYRDTFRAYLRFAARRYRCRVAALGIDQLGRRTLLAFLQDLEVTRGNSVRTRNARLAAIHSFFRYVAVEEPACAQLCREVLSVPCKRHAKPGISCLDLEEVEHILASVDCSRLLGRRDLALLLFLYNTGARAQEVVDLSVSSVRLEPPPQVRLRGKGRKERLCPLWEETADRLRLMLKDRAVTDGDDAPLFVNVRGRTLSRFGIRHIVRTRVAAAAATLPSLARKRVSPHTFRHATALHLLQSGVELNVVRSWLGHVSIATTHEYVEIDLQMKRQALEAGGVPTTPETRFPWQEPDLLDWLDRL